MRLGPLLLLAFFLWPALAHAHSTLVDVDPPDGSVLAAPPATLRLRFNEPIKPTVVQLVDSRGARRDIAFTTENDTITVTLPPDRWRADKTGSTRMPPSFRNGRESSSRAG